VLLLKADRTLVALSVLFFLLVSFAVFNGYRWTQFQRQTIEQVRVEQRQRIANLKDDLVAYESGQREPKGFLDPRGAASIGGTTAAPYLVMSPTVLAPLSVGESDLFPYFFKAGLGSKQTILSNDELENPINLLSSRFDLSFVIVYLFPLLVLTLSYNLISAEKEQGTLSQPLTPRRLVLAKSRSALPSLFCWLLSFTRRVLFSSAPILWNYPCCSGSCYGLR
jgi:ABC-2 type transport system permease protein